MADSKAPTKEEKILLIQRTLGLRHKLKVHESLPSPDTHEDLAIHTWAKWELEDELVAIEQIIAAAREASIQEKKKQIEKDGPYIKKHRD